MKNRVFKWVCVSLSIIILCLVITFVLTPALRVRSFVALYSDSIEDSMSSGHGISATLPVKSFNSWEGEHNMTEFILFAFGDTYYGCYYSFDDIPLAFQNAEVELTQNEDTSWTWTAEGDNHGETSKIKDNWYYFSASF